MNYLLVTFIVPEGTNIELPDQTIGNVSKIVTKEDLYESENLSEQALADYIKETQ
jgi:hypothetical protein